MLSPQDIRTKTFTRTIRGYNPDEVDKYIELLCEKYDEIFRENRELDYKVKTLTEQLAENNGTKEIKQTLNLAQQAADKLVRDAEKKSDAIYASAQKNTEKVLSEFRETIAKEAKVYADLKMCVKELKESIYRTYRENLEKVEKISPKADHAYVLKKNDTAAYIEKVVTAIQGDMAEYEQIGIDVDVEPTSPVAVKRTQEDTESRKFRITSVKDTMKQLNKKIISGGKENASAETDDVTDDEQED